MKKFLVVFSIIGAAFLTAVPFASADSARSIREFVFPNGVHTYSLVDAITAIGKGASFDQDKKEFVAQFDHVTIRIPALPTTTVYINDQETQLTTPVFVSKKDDNAIIFAPQKLFDKAGLTVSTTDVVEIKGAPQQTPLPEQPTLQTSGTPENPVIVINGEPLVTDTPPILKNNRVLVPLRAIFEGLNGRVNWDNNARRVDGNLGNNSVSLTIDSTTATVNGSIQDLDVPAQIVGGHTMVPLRFIGESLGAQVQWDGTNNVVTITK